MDTVINASKKLVVHKAVEATGKFIGNKIADAIAKSYDNKIVKPVENAQNVIEIIIPPEKNEEILNDLKQVL